MKNKNIYTNRLILYPLQEKHADIIVNLRSREEVYRFFKNPKKLTLQDHNIWYKETYINDNNRMDFVMALKETEQIIGTCGISNLDIYNRSMEINYLLSEQYEGNGYTSESVEELIRTASKEFNIKSTYAVIHKDNLKSINFIEKLGFFVDSETDVFVNYRKNDI